MGSSLIVSSGIGSPLQQLLEADCIQPGTESGYELCKTIWAYHILGRKIVEKPVKMAQSQPRDIAVGAEPADELKQRFIETWDRIEATRYARLTMCMSRVYGISSLVIKKQGEDPKEPLDLWALKTDDVVFSVFDPLNTSGSLVLNQRPNDIDFQRPLSIRVQNQEYDMTRTHVQMHGDPIYLSYTPSAFGYTGKSIFLPILYPLKSFIVTMRTDDLVARKAGVLIAKLTQAASGLWDHTMRFIAGFKRNIIKEAEVDNVISIDVLEDIESLNLQNLDGAHKMAREHILSNIALGSDVHAKILADEAFVLGFGEGTEDARNIAQCIDSVRDDMKPVYRFLDEICMHCAWDEDFYKTIQTRHPAEYGDVEYRDAFYQWKNSFTAPWPDLLKEPDSEEIKVKEVKFRAAAAVLQTLAPSLDPENEATAIAWLVDCINQEKLLFPAPLDLDMEALENWLVERREQEATMRESATEDDAAPLDKEPKPPKPFADAARQDALVSLKDAIARLPDRKGRRSGESRT